MNIVTIMNYPDNPNNNRMCKICLQQLVKYNPGANIFVLYEEKLSDEVTGFAKQFSNIHIEQQKRHPNPFIDVHNIRFKLHVLSSIKVPFIFVDADIFCLTGLQYLWDKRIDKPFIGVDHQQIPNHSTLHPARFLNSGVQVVGDPSWYNYEEIEKVYRSNGRLTVPGYDQAAIHDYCKATNYDYTHPHIGFGWNACAGYTKISHDGSDWIGICKGLKEKDYPPTYQVYLNHYWNEFKPWNLNCPIFRTTEV